MLNINRIYTLLLKLLIIKSIGVSIFEFLTMDKNNRIILEEYYGTYPKSTNHCSESMKTNKKS